MLHTVLLAFAFVLEVLAIWPVSTRFNLVAAGLACFFASALFS